MLFLLNLYIVGGKLGLSLLIPEPAPEAEFEMRGEPEKEETPSRLIENPRFLAVMLLCAAVSMYVFLTLAF